MLKFYEIFLGFIERPPLGGEYWRKGRRMKGDEHEEEGVVRFCL